MKDFGKLFSIVAGQPAQIERHRSGTRSHRYLARRVARELLSPVLGITRVCCPPGPAAGSPLIPAARTVMAAECLGLRGAHRRRSGGEVSDPGAPGDEGSADSEAWRNLNREPPHPNPLPQVVCGSGAFLSMSQIANKLRERGQEEDDHLTRAAVGCVLQNLHRIL